MLTLPCLKSFSSWSLQQPDLSAVLTVCGVTRKGYSLPFPSCQSLGSKKGGLCVTAHLTEIRQMFLNACVVKLDACTMAQHSPADVCAMLLALPLRGVPSYSWWDTETWVAFQQVRGKGYGEAGHASAWSEAGNSGVRGDGRLGLLNMLG